jgi:hypothetical protein
VAEEEALAAAAWEQAVEAAAGCGTRGRRGGGGVAGI